MRKRSGPCEATPCLVLRVVDYGDADRIVTLLTAAHGKISALAKGARSSRRRFGAALSSFGFGEAMLEERRGQDLWSLSDLHVTRGFPNLPHELSRFGHAAYACELCLHLCPPHVPEPEVLRLLVTLLDYLDGLPLTDKPSPLALRIFELRLLSEVGLALQLYDCAACAGPVPAAPLVPIDIRRGGVLCQRLFPRPCSHRAWPPRRRTSRHLARHPRPAWHLADRPRLPRTPCHRSPQPTASPRAAPVAHPKPPRPRPPLGRVHRQNEHLRPQLVPPRDRAGVARRGISSNVEVGGLPNRAHAAGSKGAGRCCLRWP
jgi:DNA repair protein RecO (recombination protein O)